jgi:exopolyphosphatase / guanosine-5'-triphosphate,3'-diphosphate pyrophosphatase
MVSVRRAVIDVGTNSIKLLVADIAGQDVRPVWEESKQTRLGQGLYETGQLRPEPIARTAQAVAGFVLLARQQQAVSVRVIATSAARDALNAAALSSAIERSSGLKAEIISGDQEADWAFEGVTTDPTLREAPLLLMDIGGGSAQFIVGQDGRRSFRQSVPMGTVRILERLPVSDPPRPAEFVACHDWLRTFLREQVAPQLASALREQRPPGSGGKVQLIGTGGTASILGRMEACLNSFDRERLEATCLSRARVRQHEQRVWSLPLAQRQQIIGLPPNRADVILTGVAIYAAVMEEFNFDQLRVSTRGLRFAAVRGEAAKARP